jgi:CheY-like chemotaxis protein
MRRGWGAFPVRFVPSAVLSSTKWEDRMRQPTAEPFPKSIEGLKTSFPVVPIKEIPVPDAADAASSLRPMVLVVDDEPAIADELTESLARSGYAAIAAYDAETALETALLMPPDLAVIDARLSGLSGIDLATSLRDTLPDCKIVMYAEYTADSEVLASVNAALDLGSRV